MRVKREYAVASAAVLDARADARGRLEIYLAKDCSGVSWCILMVLRHATVTRMGGDYRLRSVLEIPVSILVGTE